MFKKLNTLLMVVVIFSMLLTACQTAATPAPAAAPSEATSARQYRVIRLN